jgi:hypothetical protein
MSRALPLATALILVIAAGLVHGQLTRRWAPSPAVGLAVARLERVPMTLGEWRGSPIELNREQLDMAEIAGYVARRYVQGRDGTEVTLMLVCGRPGPISVHTPDICYAGAGYEPTGPPARQSLPIGPPGRPADFWHAVFRKQHAAVPTYLRILWAWSSRGTWEAPDNPRLTFAPRQVLYKMYIIRAMAKVDEGFDDEPIQGFLRVLLPELEKVLSGAS